MKNNFDLLMITTNDLSKQHLFLQVVQSIEKTKFQFVNKIVSIDIINDTPLREDLMLFLKKNNWIIDIHERVGMVNNIQIGLKYCNSDWILYSEDDVIINELPSIKNFESITELRPNNKVLGVLSMLSSRGTMTDSSKFEYFKNLVSDNSNYHHDENFSAWIRTPEIHENYFIEFPVTFIERNLFISLFDYANNNSNGLSIEQGLTKAFFETDLCKKYFKVNFWRPINVEEFKNLSHWDTIEFITKNKMFINTRDNMPSLAHHVNGGKNFGLKDW